MCKWEWPFVSTDTKTNKYPLITEASFFFFFCQTFFVVFTENIKHLQAFFVQTVHGSYWHLFGDLHMGQTLQTGDIVYEKEKDRE